MYLKVGQQLRPAQLFHRHTQLVQIQLCMPSGRYQQSISTLQLEPQIQRQQLLLSCQQIPVRYLGRSTNFQILQQLQ